jgi:glyoxylase-like metal-dependent hydrolase (beta-lactamase superfamily II)
MKNPALAAAVLAASLAVTALTDVPRSDAAGNAPSFNPVRVTDGVFAIYGPLELPDEHNRGFRNNVVVVDTADGVVVFDPGGSAWAGEQVASAVGAVSRAPVVAVFNSHAHGDHWLGNEGIKRIYPNVEIYGHPKMKARVEGSDGLEWLEQIELITKGSADGHIVVGPTKTMVNGDEIVIGDTTFRVHHTGPAHTDNDIMIEVVEKRVLFTGDIVRNGLLGLMESDSSFAGNVSAIDMLLSMNIEHYIPGHGEIGGKDAVVKYRTYLDTVLTQVRAHYAEGEADYEMKPAVSRALSSFSDWEGFSMRLGAHVSRAFLEVESEDF